MAAGLGQRLSHASMQLKIAGVAAGNPVRLRTENGLGCLRRRSVLVFSPLSPSLSGGRFVTGHVAPHERALHVRTEPGFEEPAVKLALDVAAQQQPRLVGRGC